ncbi:hypothetical protein LL06_07680 [Hoeflea sp. BAL378]|uniref:helix-turn-helix transcriptional regulator n=1 Tax=Hoeflea sp. BAL378 TaxID=1547437 RepID=UPI0005132017|nr:LuxR C-terminal-related transcriptional regulator [Hoeflea sp. BAL378]KGF70090.1 hypothetical protein LL06_07680 [Hoeflea sp. BAL378]
MSVDKAFSAWNEAIAKAIGAVGTAEFAHRLEAALGSIVDFDILMVFAYSGSEKPVCLYHNIDSRRARTVVDAYVSGPYILDPFYNTATDPQATGVKRLRDMAPDQFHKSEYFRRHYKLTGIRDEVGIICRPDGWTGVVISFTRPVAAPAFGRQDIAAIRASQPVIQTLADRHWRRNAAIATPAGWDAEVARDPIGEPLTRMTDGILTPREIEITSLVLQGHSSGSIARHLAIAPGTVKNHRKNIYHKLDVSSQSELFAMFIQQLSGQ